MKRLFIPAEEIKGNTATIKGGDFHHLKNVLKKKVGDEIEIADDNGRIFKSIIKEIKEKEIVIELVDFKLINPSPFYIRLFQAIPKGKSFENILQKVTELGINEIYPLITERTVVVYEKERIKAKVEKWQKIIKESAKKVGNQFLPEIKFPISLNEIKTCISGEQKILFWELEEEVSLWTILEKNGFSKNIDVVIGPEGGFSIKEVEYLKELGFTTVSLGKRIYTVETAVIVALSNLIFCLERKVNT